MKTQPQIGQQVWITAHPRVARNVVGATGIVHKITDSGRVLVMFLADDEIIRRLNVRGTYIITDAITTVNPFAK